MKKQEAERISNEIIHLYSIYGGEEYSGEKVSQLEHMVQSAQLAKAEGFNDEVVLAAFLHDIGHIAEKVTDENSMSSYGIKTMKPLALLFWRIMDFRFVLQDLSLHMSQQKDILL